MNLNVALIWRSIHREELEGLIDLRFTWKKIAEILCLSERTVRTKRHELEITDKYTGIRDNALDNFIQEIIEESPKMGEKMLQGALQSRGIQIQRTRLRSSIEGLTPLEKSFDVHDVEESIKLKDQMLHG